MNIAKQPMDDGAIRKLWTLLLVGISPISGVAPIRLMECIMDSCNALSVQEQVTKFISALNPNSLWQHLGVPAIGTDISASIGEGLSWAFNMRHMVSNVGPLPSLFQELHERQALFMLDCDNLASLTNDFFSAANRVLGCNLSQVSSPETMILSEDGKTVGIDPESLNVVESILENLKNSGVQQEVLFSARDQAEKLKTGLNCQNVILKSLTIILHCFSHKVRAIVRQGKYGKYFKLITCPKKRYVYT